MELNDYRARYAAQNVARPAQRQQAIQAQLENRLAAFEARNPGFATWWADGTTNPFAISLREQCKSRPLTERQIDAARNSMAKAEARAADARDVDVGALEQVFQVAKRNGVKKPGLRIGGFKFTLAADDYREPGAIFVRADGNYLGKVVNGVFNLSGMCSTAQRDEILAAAEQPMEAAIKHGKATGQCSICSRELTDTESIARGIGPICAEKWGW